MIPRKFDFEEGEILLIDKPLTWTSFDAVNKIRRGIKIKKVGHAGTLDPLATGLLIIATGKKTKEIPKYQEQEKEYEGTMVIGGTTPSLDLETPVGNQKDISHITAEDVIEAAQKLTGKLKQVPPQHSAIRVGGKRVYQQARKGEHTQLGWRDVEVKTFEILDEKFPEVSFRVVCSKGTYIRSLVRDLGSDLNVGAYLKSLRRTRIGSSRVEDALSPVEFLELTKAMTS